MMKKLFMSFAFIAVFFSSQATNIITQRNCSNEAIVAYDVIFALTGNMALAFQAADSTYNSCIDDGGSEGGVVRELDDSLQP